MSERAKLEVLTINIWNRSGPWHERFPKLRAGIERLAPDVVGMQEVLSGDGTTLAHEIAEGLGYDIAFGCAKELSHGYEFGNAILSRHPISRVEVFPLPSGDTDEARSVLLSELDTPHGVQPVLCTHLAWRFNHGYVRETQVKALAEVLRDQLPIREDRLPVVLVGDFNAEPDATEIRFLRGLHALEGTSTYLADCFAQAGTGPGFTFDGSRNPFAALTHERPRRIDYVFVRGPDKQGRGRPLSAEVVLDEVEDGVAPSDHFGVHATIGL